MDVKYKLARLNSVIKHREVLLRLVKNYLFFLDFPEKSIWGSITQEDEEGVKQAIIQASNYEGPIVEIGDLFGHTTNLIASLKRIDVPLIALENFSWNPFFLPPNVHRQFTKRTLRYALEHCSTEIFDGNVTDFYLANANLRPSMVFIDAGHDYESVKKDIDWAISRNCPVISGHDYIDKYPGVIEAVDKRFGDKISLYGSVWLHQTNRS